MTARRGGRKPTFVVDTQGRLWGAHVDAAKQADGPLAKQLVVSMLWRVGERLEKVFGDQAYNRSAGAGVFAKEFNRWSIDFEEASRPPWRGLNRDKVFCRWPSDGW